MHRFLSVLFLVQTLSLIAIFPARAANDSDKVADLLWIESEAKKESIKFARYDTEEWTFDDKPLYVSENPLTSLALGTDQQGQKLLIWTEQRRTKTVLMSMTAITDPVGKLKWSSPSIFSDHGRENFSASIVYDPNDQSWVFWSATTQNFSDIVVRRSNSGVWGEPEQVHSNNDVPDNSPRASVNQDGRVSVEWNSYDLDSNAYIMKNEDFEISTDDSTKVPNKLVDMIAEADIPLPTKINTERSVLLHFPLNQMIQSVTLHQGY